MSLTSRGDDPAVGCVAIAPGVLATTGRGLFITTAGAITFVMQDGSTMALASIPVGVYNFTVRSITSAAAVGFVLL
jgi:hypothetical protein